MPQKAVKVVDENGKTLGVGETTVVLWIQRPGCEMVKIDLYQGSILEVASCGKDVRQDISKHEGVEARVFLEMLFDERG